jgi:hypothetical protein
MPMDRENFSPIPPPPGPPPEILASAAEVAALRIIISHLALQMATVMARGEVDSVGGHLEDAARLCRAAAVSVNDRGGQFDEKILERFREDILPEIDGFFSDLTFAPPRSEQN